MLASLFEGLPLVARLVCQVVLQIAADLSPHIMPMGSTRAMPNKIRGTLLTGTEDRTATGDSIINYEAHRDIAAGLDRCLKRVEPHDGVHGA